MFATIVLAVITSLVWIVKTLITWYREMKTLPPGPVPIPLYGNKTPTDVHPELVNWYADLRKQHGDVFTVYQGSKPTVVVNGYDAITELLIENGNLVHSRPAKDQNILNFLHNYTGLVWNNESYRLLRKISSQSLKSYIGTYNSDLVNDGHYQVEQLLEQLRTAEQNKEFDLSSSLRDLVSHDILTMIFGLQNQEKFSNIMSLHNGSLWAIGNVDLLLRLPLLKYLPKFGNIWKNGISQKDKFLTFLQQLLDEQKGETEDKLFDSFYDTFIRHQRSQSKMLTLSEMDCHATVMQLMLAGLDAVHGSLMWLFLFIGLHTEVQDRLCKEISSQIGHDCKPTAKHMGTTPYCMAVIYETIRVSNVAFTSLPYTNQQKVTIGGQTIPANTSISVNLVSVNKDPEIFPEPEKFVPDRFLDKEGKLRNIKQFCPFSIGRRGCLGESFSKSGIFKVMVSVLQRYRLEKIQGEEYRTDSIKAFLSSPHPYNLRFNPHTQYPR